MAASASAFTITELTGEQRALRLTDRALPYRPFTLKGDQRHENEWYPGSPEATLQIFGAKEDQTTINGKWKDRFIRPPQALLPSELIQAGFKSPLQPAAGQQGSIAAQLNGEAVLSVEDLVDLVDDMRAKGQIVEVRWMSRVRQGIIASFEQSWHTKQDVEWKIVFTWMNRGSPLEDVPVFTRQLDQSDAITEIDDLLGQVTGDNASLDLDLAGSEAASALDSVNRALSDVQQAVAGLEENVIAHVQLLTTPIDLAQRAVSLYQFIQESANNVLLAISNVLEAFSLNTEVSFGARLAARETFGAQRKAMAEIIGIAAIREAQTAKELKPELLNVFIARDAQDLRDVAMQFYGDPEDWKSLMRFNGLDQSKLTRGSLIFVPRNPPRGDEC